MTRSIYFYIKNLDIEILKKLYDRNLYFSR